MGGGWVLAGPRGRRAVYPCVAGPGQHQTTRAWAPGHPGRQDPQDRDPSLARGSGVPDPDLKASAPPDLQDTEMSQRPLDGQVRSVLERLVCVLHKAEVLHLDVKSHVWPLATMLA